MKSIITATLLTFVLLFSIAPPALAQEISDGDKVVFGSNLTLGENEVVDGDLVVFGGNVTVPEAASVTGDLFVVGGNVTVHGEVAGDVTVLGGNANLRSTAVVGGSIDSFGGNVNRAEGAKSGAIPDSPEHEHGPGEGVIINVESDYTPGFASRVGNFVFDTVSLVFLLIILGGLSWLIAAFLPDHMQTVGETVTQSTLLSFGMGLLSLVLLLPASLLILTICLAVIPFALYVIIGVGLLFGWIVMGQLTGERLVAALDRPFTSFAGSTAIGVIVLTAITRMPVLEAIPFIGGLFSAVGFFIALIIALTGLGAVVLTRFGTRPYLATALASFGSDSTSYEPYTPPAAPAPPAQATDFSREVQADAALKAKIKAALTEEMVEDDNGPEDKPAQKKPKVKPEATKQTPTDKDKDEEDKQPEE